jgi:hypothetical protein
MDNTDARGTTAGTTGGRFVGRHGICGCLNGRSINGVETTSRDVAASAPRAGPAIVITGDNNVTATATATTASSNFGISNRSADDSSSLGALNSRLAEVRCPVATAPASASVQPAVQPQAGCSINITGNNNVTATATATTASCNVGVANKSDGENSSLGKLNSGSAVGYGLAGAGDSGAEHLVMEPCGVCKEGLTCDDTEVAFKPVLTAASSRTTKFRVCSEDCLVNYCLGYPENIHTGSSGPDARVDCTELTITPTGAAFVNTKAFKVTVSHLQKNNGKFNSPRAGSHLRILQGA